MKTHFLTPLVTIMLLLIGGITFIVLLYGPEIFVQTGSTLLEGKGIGEAVVQLQPADNPICNPHLNDPMLAAPFAELTKDTIQTWAESVYGNLENWSDRQLDDGSLVVWWTASSGRYRADFIEDGNRLLDISRFLGQDLELSGQEMLQCFGEPAYYQAYHRQEPHDVALTIELIYPKRGIALSSYDLSNWFGIPNPSERASFISIRTFPPTDGTKEAVAPYITQVYRAWRWSDKWDAQGWAEVALHEWNGWNDIQVVSTEIIEQGSPRAPATATAIAAAFLTAPPFPTQGDLTSPACEAVISPILYNLRYGSATLEETRLLLRGLYQDRFGATDHRIEAGRRSENNGSATQVLTWDVHTDEASEHDHYYTANFDNNVLQNSESLVYGTVLSGYIACFSNPDSAILTLNDTPNGKLQSLYLFFPKQGIVTATYLFDDEIVPPHENLPVMRAYQSSPQTDSVALLEAALGPWDSATYEEWIADLQSWQGFEQLQINE